MLPAPAAARSRLLVRYWVPRGSSCDSRPRCRTRSACSSCTAQRQAACNPGDTEKSNRSCSPESIRRSNSIASSRRRRSSRSAWAPRTARSADCVGGRTLREHRPASCNCPASCPIAPTKPHSVHTRARRPYHVHLPESRGSHAAVSERGSGWRRQCRRLQYASVRRSVRGLRGCRVLLRGASSLAPSYSSSHHRSIGDWCSQPSCQPPGLPTQVARRRSAASRCSPDPTDEPRTGAVALVSLTETIVTPAQTRPASRDSRLAQYGGADADEIDPTR